MFNFRPVVALSPPHPENRSTPLIHTYTHTGNRVIRMLIINSHGTQTLNNQ